VKRTETLLGESLPKNPVTEIGFGTPPLTNSVIDWKEMIEEVQEF
jgi:hypothetical protein